MFWLFQSYSYMGHRLRLYRDIQPSYSPTLYLLLRGQSAFYDLSGNSAMGHRGCGERSEPMNLRRTKFKRTTPRSQTVFTQVDLDLGGGINRLLFTVARVIEKYFGLLYMNMNRYVFI